MAPDSVGGRLAGKVAVVTGGGGGIGQATAQRFAEEGARVAIIDVDGIAASNAADALIAIGYEAVGLEADVSVEEDVRGALSSAAEHLGPVSALANCAGIGPIEDGPVGRLDSAVWDRVLAVNLRGTFLACKHAINSAAGTGQRLAIVNVASVVGLVASSGDATAYAASKGGVMGLTKQIAATYADKDVRCNAVCPGPVETPILRSRIEREGRERFTRLIPMGRMGQPEEIATLIAYLASDDSAFVTGSLFVIDGGLTVR